MRVQKEGRLKRVAAPILTVMARLLPAAIVSTAPAKKAML
jgi:hypothetical protein